jgi:two-component system, OmpR family, sensor kinase
MRRIPLRLRLTLAFATGMALVLVALGVLLHARFAAGLTGGIDQELRSRAQVILSAIARQGPSAIAARGDLIDPDEAFGQVLDRSGRIVDSSQGVSAAPMVTVATLRSAAGRPVTSVTTRVTGVDDDVRLLIVPAPEVGGAPAFVIVGSTLGDRNEALGTLTELLAVFGLAALALASFAGWLLAGAALRPVERMRIEASAISVSELDRRLALPPADDELRRLGSTLNDLLARLEEAFRTESRFLDQASHELRTPLAVLKMELDLAASTPSSSREEMRAGLEAASVEADRLVRLAEDLLVLARVNRGRLPVRRTATDVRELIESVCRAHRARAQAAGITLACEAPECVAWVDPSRIRQALEDLVDNALRHAGSTVRVSARMANAALDFEVGDDGPGFPPSILAEIPSPFAQSDGAAPASGGVGLGLPIVGAVAAAHGGVLRLSNLPSGGAIATIVLPAAATAGGAEEDQLVTR